MRTAVCPTFGCGTGITMTASACGVRTSTSPFMASKVPASANTSSPCNGRTQRNCGLATVTTVSISTTRCTAGSDRGAGPSVEASFANLIVENGLIANVAAFAGFQKGAASLSIGGDVKVVIGPDVAAAASLEAAVAQIAQATASGGASAFEYAGSTYIFKQNGTAAAESGDGLIKIIGVTGITHSSDANSFY